MKSNLSIVTGDSNRLCADLDADNTTSSSKFSESLNVTVKDASEALTVIEVVSNPILDTVKLNGGVASTSIENSPLKSATAPVVESKTTLAPGIGVLSLSTTTPVTLVCARMNVLNNTNIIDKIFLIFLNLILVVYIL